MAARFYGIFDVGRGEQGGGNFLFQERPVTKLPSADLDEAIVPRRKTLGAEKLFQQEDKTRVFGIDAEGLPSKTLNAAIFRSGHQAQQTAMQPHEKKKIALLFDLDRRHDIIGCGVADFKLALLERRDEKIRTRGVSDFDFETMPSEDAVCHRRMHREIIGRTKLDESQMIQIRP